MESVDFGLFVAVFGYFLARGARTRGERGGGGGPPSNPQALGRVVGSREATTRVSTTVSGLGCACAGGSGRNGSVKR